MKLLWAFVLLGIILAANGEIHKLTYIYTGLSKPINLPGIHEFTAMGMLDDRIIDYYDSVDQRRIPKVDWMKKHLSADYWEKGTQSRQSKQQWFKTNIEILMNRMRQSDTDLHVLQWMHGCEGETQPDGSLKFVRGMDKYNYDGEDFLSFDDTNEVWVAHTVAAEPTKRKWDNVQVLKEFTRGYLEKECIDWLSKFLVHGEEQLKQAERPTVHLFAKKSNIQTKIVLTCLATGFLPKETEMKIKRGNEVLTRADGVYSTGPLPNGDDTFQRRDYIEVHKDDRANYTCEVSHTVSGFAETRTWVMTELPSDEGSGFPIGAVVGGGLVVPVGIIGLVYFLKKREKSASPVSPTNSPVDTDKLDVTSIVRNRSTNVSSGGTTNPVYSLVDTVNLVASPLVGNEGTNVSSGGTTKPRVFLPSKDFGVAFYSLVDTEKLDVTPLVGNRSTNVSSGGTTNPGGSRGNNDSGVASAANPEEAKSLLPKVTAADPEEAKSLLPKVTEANPEEAKSLLPKASAADPEEAKVSVPDA